MPDKEKTERDRANLSSLCSFSRITTILMFVVSLKNNDSGSDTGASTRKRCGRTRLGNLHRRRTLKQLLEPAASQTIFI